MTRHAPRTRLADLYNAYDRLASTPGGPVQIADIGAAVGGADMDTVIMMFRRAHQPMKVRDDRPAAQPWLGWSARLGHAIAHEPATRAAAADQRRPHLFVQEN